MSKLITALTVFGGAMGYLESAVVVYLRALYYPEGFTFPLRPLSTDMYLIECLREMATLVMLGAVGVTAGRSLAERFSCFLFSFGVWDISYYLWLKVLLDWPSSLLSWDILFLIPVVWVGPVIAPLICSLGMIMLAVVVLNAVYRSSSFRLGAGDWALLSAGSLLIVTAFVGDFAGIVLSAGRASGFESLQSAAAAYVPERFNWGLFASGEALVLVVPVRLLRMMRRSPGNDQ